MGIEFETDGNLNNTNLYSNFNNLRLNADKYVINESCNIKVALWQMPYEIPYSKICKRYDSDNNGWLEYRNNHNENEIEEAEKTIGSKLCNYKVIARTTNYSDGTTDVISEYPNGTKITEHHEDNSVFVNIKDKDGRTVAEKIYSYETTKGRKVVYQNLEKDNNIFSVARVYSYDTRLNRKTDIVNFGYTNSAFTLTNGCYLEKEYYLLNGEEVKAKCKKDGKYKVKDKNGKKFKFKAE